MNTSEMIHKIKGEEVEQDTIIPEFQNPDVCVFCTDNESLFYELLKATYEENTNRRIEKQSKETCIHHKDEWLKHSYYTAGFMWSAFTDYDKNKSMTVGDIEELFRNKEEREKILTEYYNKQKDFTCGAHLHLKTPLEIKDRRYSSNAFTIEDDIPVQNKILQNKLKIYYTNAIEVLQAYAESYKS